VVSRNFEASPDRYLKVAEAMGIKMVRMPIEKKKALLIKAIQTLNASVGITRSLGTAGVRREDIPGLAEKALNDPCMVTNPCWLGQADVEEIYAASL
jgi:alcohol dehydrogenase class IV